jgi:hypothetical protein
MSLVESLPQPQPKKAIILDGEDLLDSILKLTQSLLIGLPTLKFTSLHQLFLALARTLKVICKRSRSQQSKLQFRKIFSRFRRFVEDNEDITVGNDQPEVGSSFQILRLAPDSLRTLAMRSVF